MIYKVNSCGTNIRAVIKQGKPGMFAKTHPQLEPVYFDTEQEAIELVRARIQKNIDKAKAQLKSEQDRMKRFCKKHGVQHEPI